VTDAATIERLQPSAATPEVRVRTEGLPHIVVVGGGAGGLELVTRLGDKLGCQAALRRWPSPVPSHEQCSFVMRSVDRKLLCAIIGRL
jgi:hypothetical protein